MIGKNNPFNIRYSEGNYWLGQTGKTANGFCVFSSLEYGVRAAAILIMKSYRKKNVLTISEIINRYAPKSENDTDKYISFVCSKLGCFPFDIPCRYQFPKLLEAMSIFEGNRVSSNFIECVIERFKIIPYKCK